MGKRRIRVWTDSDISMNEESTTLTAQLHGLSCPTCKSNNYIKSGKEKGNQRYSCKKCGKHFRSTTGNTIHHLHLKPKIQEYINCMNEGLSLRKTAKKCDISLRTAFRWRHRFLSAMESRTDHKQCKRKTLSAIVLPFSRKGKAEVKERQAKITSLLQIDALGKIRLHVLGKYGQSGNTLLEMTKGNIRTTKSKAIPKLFKTKTAKHLSRKELIRTNMAHIGIHNWLIKFRGVATRYLENYWNWYMLINQLQIQNSKQSQYMQHCF